MGNIKKSSSFGISGKASVFMSNYSWCLCILNWRRSVPSSPSFYTTSSCPHWNTSLIMRVIIFYPTQRYMQQGWPKWDFFLTAFKHLFSMGLVTWTSAWPLLKNLDLTRVYLGELQPTIFFHFVKADLLNKLVAATRVPPFERFVLCVFLYFGF